MEIKKIVSKMESSNNFKVNKPCGLPNILEKHLLPDDVKTFYNLCGGVECYIESGGFPLVILPPKEIKLSNIVLLGNDHKDDISSSWYLIVDAYDGNYLSIDFDRKRVGKCYESFEYSHAVKDNCPIIARSFTELLINIFDYCGDYFFWKDNEKFSCYGDAYQ